MIRHLGVLTRADVRQLARLHQAAFPGFFLSNLGQPVIKGYLGGFLLDSTIVAYSVLYFISDQGHPQRWNAMK